MQTKLCIILKKLAKELVLFGLILKTKFKNNSDLFAVVIIFMKK
jgi:hypothetical protein